MVTDRVTEPADVSTATWLEQYLSRHFVQMLLMSYPQLHVRQSTSTNPPSLQPTQVSTNPPFQHAPHANPLFGPVFQSNMQPLSETPRSMIYSFPSTRPSSNPSQSNSRIQLLQLCSLLVLLTKVETWRYDCQSPLRYGHNVPNE